MKSSTGKYYIGLDHVRALAAFLVFCWHFIHVTGGHKAGPPAFPLSPLAEGHTGVAVFMVLSGYLFAKLLDGKKIDYRGFIWNRFLRLAPLLITVIILVGLLKYVRHQDLWAYAIEIMRGVYTYTLPNGGWSITAEFHFYLLLPLFLWLARKWRHALWVALAGSILLRTAIFLQTGEVQMLSYWSIVGRVDQFLLGMLVCQWRHKLTGRHLVAALTTVAFLVFYWYFDHLGGFNMNVRYPSPSPIWIILPTIEAIAYGVLIGWYDTSFQHSTGRISRFIALIGTYSYSIYLLHVFIVFRLSRAIHHHLIDLTNIHMAILLAPVGFLVMIPIAHLSYHYIELPFLRFRVKYITGETKKITEDSPDTPITATTPDK